MSDFGTRRVVARGDRPKSLAQVFHVKPAGSYRYLRIAPSVQEGKKVPQQVKILLRRQLNGEASVALRAARTGTSVRLW